MVDIALLDDSQLADDQLMRAVYDVLRGASLHGREHRPFFSFRASLAHWRIEDPGSTHALLVARDDDAIVGCVHASLPLLDNTDKLQFELCVAPGHRRRGIGTALLAALEQQAAAHARTVLVTESHFAYTPGGDVSGEPGYAFALDRGFKHSITEPVRDLVTPMPQQRAEELAAAFNPDGPYRIETLVDEVPDEYVESLCRLMAQLVVDAPTGESDWEEEAVTSDRLDAHYRAAAQGGLSIFETVALEPDGTVVAQTTLLVPLDEDEDTAYQWGTFVHRQHRGHRLGLAVKVGNQQAMQRAAPHVRRVVTQNAEANAHMVSINDLMGFQITEGSYEFVKRL